MLQVGSSLVNQGTFDGGNSPASLGANCLVDLTAGTWKNLSGLSVAMGSNALLIVPAGFNMSTGLAGFTTTGLPVHVQGTTLTVPAGTGFGGIGTVSDLVVCQGTIAGTSSGGITLVGGLLLSGNGNAALAGLTVNNPASGQSGGSLSAPNEYIGNGGTGRLPTPPARTAFPATSTSATTRPTAGATRSVARAPCRRATPMSATRARERSTSRAGPAA